MTEEPDPDDIAADLQSLADELGESPTEYQYKHWDDAKYTKYQAKKMFGSWNESLEYADLDLNRHTEDYLPSDEDLYEMYYGEQMSVEEIADKYGVSESAINNCFLDTEYPKTMSKAVRQVLYETRIAKEDVRKRITAGQRRIHGILEEDGDYVFNPDFALRDEVKGLEGEDTGPRL